ncbi:putative WD repeat-containing protein [Wickerhamomyces ciferrii]|uniref:WD repeat-containing protein JIP5 n=1 Tax=Wickerhamomyces ciferrii (strain ATCC 14091 / BCRC 22168 / CBS 111 / JCM 3599 / NBRC 0793 / NRRL Y-1031 F-60-10) TaxID=1206466 RepID=K0KB73_WICCF|nr:putative WD repeat-containing protein [Wickerhamomyces ciferrii]CCH42250.1 putative WD repeat-containing protein [Wickerhamomyces ciferrii]
MGKKSSKKGQSTILESNVSPLLEFKYDAPLFALAAHPTKPIIVSGLANGYVFMIEYDSTKLSVYQHDQKESIAKEEKEKAKSKKQELESSSKSKKKQKFWKVHLISKNSEDDLNNGIKTIWKTKRHKGSVRSICFNAEGDEIYTVGSDNVIKRANAITGKVLKKIEIDSKVLITKIIKSQTHPFIITGDEVGNIRIFDINLKQINIIQNVHDDAINNIIQLSHKSAYQFLSVGSTTLSTWDIRKQEPKMTSENQEDEILSCTFVDPTQGDTLVCGMGEGIVTIWKQSKNDYVDQLSRVKVSKDESIDSVISTLNNDDCIWAGCSNGSISKINAKKGQVIETRIHGSIDEVSFLDLDFEYRLISAGMDKLKLWNNDDDDDEDEDEEVFSEELSDSEEEDEDDEDDEDDEESNEFKGFSDDKESGSDVWEDLGSASEEEEQQDEEKEKPEPKPEPESKKHEIQEPIKKSKKQKLTPKQLKNQLSHEHGIRRFDDL